MNDGGVQERFLQKNIKKKLGLYIYIVGTTTQRHAQKAHVQLHAYIVPIYYNIPVSSLYCIIH
jgi:hypothetical protein